MWLSLALLLFFWLLGSQWLFLAIVNLPFFIARRYLVRQKGAFSSFIIRLAIGATALSVATMIVAVAFITGFKYEIREKIFSFWGHVHITPYNVNTGTLITPDPISKNPLLEKQIAAMPQVREVVPFAVRPGIIQADQTMEGLQLKGVNNNYRLPKNVSLQGNFVSYADSSYSKDIVISQTTADRLKLKQGDEMQLYFLEPGSSPRIRRVTVAGIFHTGMAEVDKEYALCDMRLLQRINNWGPDQINGYQLTLTDEALSDTVANEIYARYLEPPLSISTMREIFPNIFSWLGFIEDVNERLILIIMAIVAVMNLAAALLILIVEQARMVGLLKAQGMTNGGMQQIFMYYAGLIAGIGILLGNVVALGICWLQQRFGFLQLSESTYYMRYAPVRLHWWQPVLINIATLVLCILCMWLPTLYIRRIQPARVLQFK